MKVLIALMSLAIAASAPNDYVKIDHNLQDGEYRIDTPTENCLKVWDCMDTDCPVKGFFMPKDENGKSKPNVIVGYKNYCEFKLQQCSLQEDVKKNGHLWYYGDIHQIVPDILYDDCKKKCCKLPEAVCQFNNNKRGCPKQESHRLHHKDASLA